MTVVAVSPFLTQRPRTLSPGKFVDSVRTLDGSPRASVELERLDTLWFNTGTLCNIACANCYIDSSPTNDALAYLTRADARAYLDEVAALALPTAEIGFTGGEPFMNPDILPMIKDALEAGYRVLVLTNAMRPMMRWGERLAALGPLAGERLTLRVSLDHHTRAIHDAERGDGSWDRAWEGLRWLRDRGFRLAVAGRRLAHEDETLARTAFAEVFAAERLAIDALDPGQLVLFPEMEPDADVPEITEACWSILQRAPRDMMCARSRMVVRRRGSDAAVVVACTLIPHDPGFEMGRTLAEASGTVSLNHPFCAQFCVLGGASCSA